MNVPHVSKKCLLSFHYSKHLKPIIVIFHGSRNDVFSHVTAAFVNMLFDE